MNERVRFWAPQTGMTPQYGTIAEHCQTPDDCGSIPYAKIIPDTRPEPVYLCKGAVWGYGFVADDRKSG